MKPKAVIGLVRSREAYIRDWVPVFERHGVSADSLEPAEAERVFDLTEVLTGDLDREVEWTWEGIGRELPFPMFAMVGNGDGVCTVCGSEDGVYFYHYRSPVPIIIARFTPNGVSWDGLRLDVDGTPFVVNADDPTAKQTLESAVMLLKIVTDACNDTRHVVSYTLNRAERRAASRETGTDTLRTTIVHRVCLDRRTRESFAEARGDTVVPTPKRLHEVRAHWRHLRSGLVTRVKAHRRGSRGTLQPRVYEVGESNSKSASVVLAVDPSVAGQ